MTPYFGWKPSKPDHRDYTLTDPHAPAKLPAKISLRGSADMPKVYDQGQLGSCTANAIGSAYEFELKRQGEDFMPSRLWIYYQERALEGTIDQDAGAEIRDGLKVVGKIGVCPEKDWPYDIGTFTGPPPSSCSVDATKSHAINYYSLNLGPGAPLRACIAAGFPFVFGFNVPAEFENLTASDPLLHLPGPDVQFIGGHAVKAVGYDYTRTRFPVNVFEVKNSWGTGFADDGYFYMDARCFSTVCSDLWTIRSTT
jgi:C1A family cysteine protease